MRAYLVSLSSLQKCVVQVKRWASKWIWQSQKRQNFLKDKGIRKFHFCYRCRGKHRQRGAGFVYQGWKCLALKCSGKLHGWQSSSGLWIARPSILPRHPFLWATVEKSKWMRYVFGRVYWCCHIVCTVHSSYLKLRASQFDDIWVACMYGLVCMYIHYVNNYSRLKLLQALC